MIKRDKVIWVSENQEKGQRTSIKAKPQEIRSEKTEVCIHFLLIGQDLYRFH